MSGKCVATFTRSSTNFDQPRHYFSPLRDQKDSEIVHWIKFRLKQSRRSTTGVADEERGGFLQHA